MTEQSNIMDGLEEAYRDGLVDVEHPADPKDEPEFGLSQHGEAAANDLLRENESAVLYLVELHCARLEKQNEKIPKGLAELGVLIAEDIGINIYRVIQRNLDEIEWLTADAITDEEVAELEKYIPENKERYNDS